MGDLLYKMKGRMEIDKYKIVLLALFSFILGMMSILIVYSFR